MKDVLKSLLSSPNAILPLIFVVGGMGSTILSVILCLVRTRKISVLRIVVFFELANSKERKMFVGGLIIGGIGVILFSVIGAIFS